MEKREHQSVRKCNRPTSSPTNLQGHRTICPISRSVKRNDLGSDNRKDANHKAGDCENPIHDTTRSNGNGLENSSCSETLCASYARGLENSSQPPLPTTLSPCECALERTIDSTTARPLEGFVHPVTPEYQVVKHTEKNERTILCPICGGRDERGRGNVEVRSQSR